MEDLQHKHMQDKTATVIILPHIQHPAHTLQHSFEQMKLRIMHFCLYRTENYNSLFPRSNDIVVSSKIKLIEGVDQWFYLQRKIKYKNDLIWRIFHFSTKYLTLMRIPFNKRIFFIVHAQSMQQHLSLSDLVFLPSESVHFASF